MVARLRPWPLAAFAIAAGCKFSLGSQPALAQTTGQQALNSGDTAWMLAATALVLMMTVPGVALFYGGLVRKKNVLSTVMQSFAVCCIATLVWMICGYSLAFSVNPLIDNYMGGLDRIMLDGLSQGAMRGSIPESVFMMFQMTFAIITPALITGAVADRMKFASLLVFLTLWMIVVYAPITYWVWGGGFLGDDGMLDYAGGTVVHISSGIAGLVAAIMLGKRTGLGKAEMMPHNLVYSLIGASLLWVGWFGFNAGSALAANNSAGMAMAVTQISAAAGAIAWKLSEWASSGKPTLLGLLSGAVSGLVAITPAAGFVDPKGALIIGLIAGIACYFACTAVKQSLGYDDALDVFGIHGVGGIVGALLTGVFAIEAIGGTRGVLEGNIGQLLIQAEGAFIVLGYSAAMTFVILALVKITIGLRVDRELEIEGLDRRLHGEVVL